MNIVLLILAVIFVTAIALLFDYKTSHKWYRVAGISLSGLMLIGFITEPKLWPSAQTADIALLTDGVQGSGFSDSEYDSVYSVLTFKPGSNRQMRPHKWISSVQMLQQYVPAGSNVDIFGYGTDENLPGRFFWGDRLTPPKTGILLNRAPAQIETGHPFELSVTLRSPLPGDSLNLYRDGIRLAGKEPGSDGVVTFQDELFSEGPAYYQFEWLHDNSVHTETWNIRGIKPPRLNIGILLYSPSFEINYLAEHLSGKGHHVASRTRIGEERFRFDDINNPLPDARNILSDPAEFDLIILDIREYLQMNLSEQRTLKNATENGLDILLAPPSTDETDDWAGVFSDISDQTIVVESLNRLEERLWFPDFIDSGLAEMNRIPLLDLNFNPQENSFRVFGTIQNRHPVSIRRTVQNGSVTSHLFYQTYSWLLRGEEGIYNEFWSRYLAEIVTLESSLLEISESVPRRNHPVTITSTNPDITHEMTVLAVESGSTYKVPVTTGHNHPHVASAQFIPAHSGWHRVDYNGDSVWFYVYESDWGFDESMHRYKNTSGQIRHQQNGRNVNEADHRTKVPDAIWLLGFLLLQAALWIERKIV